MKKLWMSIGLMVIAGMAFSQTVNQTEEKKIQYSDKSIIKSAEVKKTEAESKQETKAESKPVIIQTLEYKHEESKVSIDANKTTNANTVVVPEEKKAEPTIEEQKENLDNNIKAIDTKVAWVKSNPAEDKRAKESGWYDQMEESKKSLLKKKEELTNSEK